MEGQAAVGAVIEAARRGELRKLRRLLAADPALAAGIDAHGRTALFYATVYSKEHVVRLLLEAAPEAALIADQKGNLPLHWLFGLSIEVVRLLVDAAPAAAIVPNADGRLPLHMAVFHIDQGQEDVLRLLLSLAPAAALTADAYGQFPLHTAAARGCEGVVRLLLEAAPAAAARAADDGRFPLHWAAAYGNQEAVQMLLAAAPEAASKRGGKPRRLPLEEAMLTAASYSRADSPRDPGAHLMSARLLLPATPTSDALAALLRAGKVAWPLFADLAASRALSLAQWKRIPAPCPGLGAALPAVLSRSEAEGRQLVRRLPDAERCRLRAAALALGWAQRALGIELPAVLVRRVLALAAAG